MRVVNVFLLLKTRTKTFGSNLIFQQIKYKMRKKNKNKSSFKYKLIKKTDRTYINTSSKGELNFFQQIE